MMRREANVDTSRWEEVSECEQRPPFRDRLCTVLSWKMNRKMLAICGGCGRVVKEQAIRASFLANNRMNADALHGNFS